MASWSKKPRVEKLDDLKQESSFVDIVKKMFCWGSSVHGELGLGGIEDESILLPRAVNFPYASEVVQIACGNNFTVLLTQSGQIYSCGNNDYGQLGHEKSRKKLNLVPGIDAYVFKKVACGSRHTLAVNEWGQIFTWGCNADGQLGLNSTNIIEYTPSMVKTLGTNIIVQIACGLKHTLALTNNGELFAWGSNCEGQLGLGTDVEKELKPKLIYSLATIPIAYIACGGYHSIAISKSGAVFGWGKNNFGQLGLNDMQNKNLPCQLKTLRNSKVSYAACGEEFSIFLTKDGGVFTCGAGMYGQLGHGSKSNEILPRQVMELMGSTVTQISCGKKHILALVPSRGRVYAWGLGGTGQLGNRITKCMTTPQVVLGPWITPSGSSVFINDSQLNLEMLDCIVTRIFSGGDHCFVTVSPRKDHVEPDDYRITPTSSQILTVKQEELAACQRVPLGASVDMDLITYLETVFKHQACLNASFLVSNDGHYGCSVKNHGVNFDLAAKLFGIISELDSTSIKEIIFTCISESLIPSLIQSPPDVESLRVYLILPLYHGFADPSNCNTLLKPFGKALLNLKPEAQRIVCKWWEIAPLNYFERLIRIHKAVAVRFIRNIGEKDLGDSALQVMLDVLTLLNKINEDVDGNIKLPYETFHITELKDFVDIRIDYFNWLTEKERSYKIYFCDYPFIFNTQAKTTLLETDQAIQMQLAMNEATTRAITHILFNSNLASSMDAQPRFLNINVSRANIVQDTLNELSRYNSNDYKRPLKVKFHGEEAEDAGGVRKEFFMLLLKEILDPKYGMFKEYEETRTIWFSEDSFENEVMYLLIGILCGLTIYNFVIIYLPFPLVLYKKLLHEPVGLNDLKELSPEIAKSMQYILDYDESPDLEAVFSLNFEVVRDAFGEKKTYELIPGGSKIPVTLENRKQFVELYVDYVLNKSVDTQFQAFYKGFHKVCGGRVLKLFHSHELMAVIIGNENYDWEELEKNATYKNGYTKDDPTIVLFWQVFHELPLEEKKKFLLFLTGSDRIPIQGMGAIVITIQPMTDERFLPAAHTCFNLLDLPRYQTRERLRYKLLQAIQQTQGFSLV